MPSSTSAASVSTPAAGSPSPLGAWRAEFPVTRNLIYFNHAAVTPLSLRARHAMETLLAELTDFGARDGDAWMTGYDQCRRSIAQLIHAQPASIALLKNTTEGMATVALGLDWRPGDRILTLDCEFPTNLYPWLALRERGVQVEFVPHHHGLVDLDALRHQARGGPAARPAKLVTLSLVQYVHGARLDVAAVGQICRETGTLFFLDAIQGLGAFPVDALAGGVHFLAADAHKWLTGPEGAALFYIHPDALPLLTPRVVGWMSVENWADHSAAARLASSGAALPWRPDASRFECGTLNTLGLRGLAAAVDLLLEAGPAPIAAQILSLTRQLADGLRTRGAEILGPRHEPGARDSACGGIVSFRLPSIPTAQLFARLQSARICCAQRQGYIRCSPHFYNSSDEVAQFLAALP